jgi:hypothetical protein
MAGVGGSRKAEVWEGIVDWDPSSREALQKRYEFEQLPTTEEVLLAQEDLWVYEAILNVVTATNEGAKGPADAAVRRISSIQIGRDAIGAWTRSGRSAIQSTMSPSGEDPITFATPKPAGGAAAAERAKPAAKDLTSNRYVEDNGKPLAQSDKSPYAEFKMMPVVLELTVDERRIPDLLVNCANSNMPIEVRMIRLRPGAGEAQQLAAGLNVAAGTGHTPPAGTMARTDSLAFDMPIEIQGLIYIYNPPDEKQLGTGAAAAETAGAAAGSGAATTETPTPKTTPATPKNGAGGATQGGGQTTPPANDATTPNGTTPPATGTAPTASGGQTPGAGGLPAGGQPAETGGAAHGQQPTGGAL